MNTALTDEQLRTLSQLLDHALDLTSGERADWLDRLEDSDGALKPVLARMLENAKSREWGGFLATFPDVHATSADWSRITPIGFAAGDHVGPYRLLRQVGRGGMATVWVAERTDGLVSRQVALKLPYLTGQHARLSERFAREREILASLSHPNIARLYDVGVSGGQPYLAMEYVEGQPLTTYCDTNQLALRARIELFVKVLAAVQYAHQRLVVHRDLKPSNILVTADGDVRLLDFGIAKLLVEGEARETELTQVEGRPLTPNYASPEQVAGAAIDTSSDVYSLGVVLYELMTGSRPYRLKHQSRGALEDAILVADPARPSETVTDDAASVRHATRARIERALQGDLDTIVLKALKKMPAERYGTALAFADDLQRYLAGEPVLARPDSTLYRVRKFVTRNRVPVAAAAAVIFAALLLVLTATAATVVALTCGLALALWQAYRARRHARIAENEAQRALAETRTAQAVQAFLRDIFQANSIDQADPAKARQTTAAELLDIGAKKIDSSLHDAPNARLQVIETLAQMYEELELTDRAAMLNRKRVELAKSLFGPDDPVVAHALVRLAACLRPSPAVDERQQVLDFAKRILDRRGDATSKTRARLILELAYSCQDDDAGKALELTQQAIAIAQHYPPDRDSVSAWIQQGVLQMLRGDSVASESSHLSALQALDAIQPPTNHNRSQIYTYLGQAQRELQKFAAAEQSHRLALEVATTAGGSDHQLTLIAKMDLGWFLFDTGRVFEGIEIMADARREIIATRSGDPQTIPWAFNRHGRACAQVGRLREGHDDLARAVTMLREFRPGGGYLAFLLDLLARVLVDLGRYADAAQALDEAAEIHAHIRDEPIYVNENIAARVQLHCATGSAADAGRALDAFFVQPPIAGTISLTSARRSLLEATVQSARGDSLGALERASRVKNTFERSASRAHFKIYEAQAALAEGKALLALHRSAEAAQSLRRVLALGRDLYDCDRSPVLADAQLTLASALLDIGDEKEAMTLLGKATTIHAANDSLGAHWTATLAHFHARSPAA